MNPSFLILNDTEHILKMKYTQIQNTVEDQTNIAIARVQYTGRWRILFANQM